MTYLQIPTSEKAVRSSKFSYLGTSTPSSRSVSSSTPHNPRSCYTDSSTQTNKRFHPSHLGKPAGWSHQHTTRNMYYKPTPPPLQKESAVPKIAPMKEVEKMITDLKKENFDLKLRLYHLEDMMTKDLDLYQLKQQNCGLRMNLEDQSKHMERLERELTTLLNRRQSQQQAVSVGVQTDSEEEEQEVGVDVANTPAATMKSFYTAHESLHESFALLSLGKQHHSHTEDQSASLVRALQQLSLDTSIESWLNGIDHEQQGGAREGGV